MDVDRVTPDRLAQDKLTPEARALVTVLDEVFPKVDVLGDAEAARKAQREIPRDFAVDDVASADDRTIPGPAGEIPVRVYRPSKDGAPRPGVVFFHGGGWVICDLETHDGACRRIANEVDAVVVAVDYRLAPQHKFPAAVEDSYAATRWVAEHADELGINPTRLAVAGDSAGGNLAAAVALMARDRGGPPLAFQMLVYPVIDSTAGRNDYPSKTENAEGYFLTTSAMNWYRDQYVADESDADDPYLSPIRAESLAGLPPAVIVVAEADPLRDEGEEYARALDAAGVPVMLHCAIGMFHGFFNMDALLPAVKDSQAVAFRAARAALHG
jgi:acetyl esterase